MQNRSTEMN